MSTSGSKDMLGLSASQFMKGGRRRKSKVYRGGALGDAISAAGAGAGNALNALFKPAASTPPAEVKAGGGKRSMSLQRGRSMRRARSMQASRAGGKKTHRRRKHRSRKHKGGVILQ